MHDDIRKFSLEGDLGDNNVVVTKERLINHIEGLMRDYSYVPALDLEPQFSLDYRPEDEAFHFTLSVYGVKVEKEEAWKLGGIMSGKRIERFTSQTK